MLGTSKEFSKVREYKINIQKLAAFPYTNNEVSEKGIQKMVTFTTASKEYFGINVTKEVKDLYILN
jgi:hypothetical protein